MRRLLPALVLLAVSIPASPTNACTFFTKMLDGQTFAGNSEDYYEADTCVVFLPPAEGKYGRVYFGWTHVWMQGGVNDHGLAYDIMALYPREYIKPPEGRKLVPGRLGLIRKILEECATVAEALKLVNTHVNPLSGGANLMLADATGDSAIVEGYTVYRRKGPYQICTNFRWAKAGPTGWRDDRYKAAEAILKDCPVTVDAFRSVLDAVHQPLTNNTRGTLYSNIYDLKNNRIYLYLLHDFSRVHVIDMNKELAKGPRVIRMHELFPPNDRDVKLRRRYEAGKRTAFRVEAAKLGPPRKAPADAGPALQLALDGDAKDAGPNHLDGKAGAAKACPDRRGKAGAALAFAGEGGVEIPHHDDLNLSAGDFTIALWLKADAEGLAGEHNQVILEKMARGKLDYLLWLVNGRLQVHFKGTNACLLSPVPLTRGRWRHLAIRQDVAACRVALFLDGKELLSTMLHTIPDRNDAPLRLGFSGIFPQAPFHGALDDLRIYHRPLTNAEIAALAGGAER